MQYVQMWVRVIRKGSETLAFKYSKGKEESEDVAIVSDARETPIHETKLEGINDLLDDGYEVYDDRLPYPENKPIPTGNNDHPLYKEEWKWSGIYHRRQAGCWQ